MNRNLVMAGMMISIITAVIYIGYSPVKSIVLLLLVLCALYTSMRGQPQKRDQKKFLDLSMFEERLDQKSSLYSNYSQQDRQTYKRISDRDMVAQNPDNQSPIRYRDFQSYVQNPVESRIINEIPITNKKKKNFSGLYESDRVFEESMMIPTKLDSDFYKRSQPPKSKQDQFDKTKQLLQKRLPYLDDYARGVKDHTLRLIKFYLSHFKTSITALNVFMKNHFNRQIYEMEYFNQQKYFQLDIISLQNIIELESLMDSQLIIKPLDFQRFEKEKQTFKELVSQVNLCMSICQNDLSKVQRIIEMDNEPFDITLDLFVQMIKSAIKLDKSIEFISVDIIKVAHFDWDKEVTEYSARNVFLLNSSQTNYYSDQVLLLLKEDQNTNAQSTNKDFILYTPQTDMIYYAIAYYIFHLQLLPKAQLAGLQKSSNVFIQQINEMRQHLSISQVNRLSRQESNYSFHNLQTVKVDWDPRIICAVHVIFQLFALGISYYLLKSNDVITLGLQTCLVYIIMTLCYIHLYDQELYQVDHESHHLILGTAVLQLISALAGFLALKYVPFSQAASLLQLTPIYMQVLSHVLIQPGPQKILIIAFIQTLAIFLYDASGVIILGTLMQPISLALSETFRTKQAKTVPQLTMTLYTNSLALPIYVMSAMLGSGIHLESIFGAILICFFSLISGMAKKALTDLLQLNGQQLALLQGMVTLSAIVLALLFGQQLTIASVVIVLVVVASVAVHN